jgi:Predicted integral membrane protein (DUF2269)
VFTALVTLHICSVVIGFGPLFVYPLLVRTASAPSDRQAIVRAMLEARRKVSEPAFLIVGPLGIAAALVHPDESVFSRLWVQLAIPLWLFAVVVVWFVQRPIAKRVARAAEDLVTGPTRAKAAQFDRLSRWLTRVTWVSWVGLVGMIVLMLTRPA